MSTGITVADEIQILETSLSVANRALDDLAGACMDDNGNPKAPDRRILMRARSMLPPTYENSFGNKMKG